MQRAKNVPDAFSGLPWKTSLLRCSRQNRVQRVLAVRNVSPYHAPHPAVVPVPYSHRHRRAKFWRPDSKSFCRFVPQPFRVIDKLAVGNLTKCALIQTSLRFVCRAVCDAQKTEKRREFSGQDVQLYNRARTAIRLPPGQGCAPTPRQRLTARKNSAYRSPFPNSSNRKSRGPAPLAWVPIL